MTELAIRRATRRFCAAACLLAVVSGCVDTYERRLEETNNYFHYLNKLNDHLAPSKWADIYGFGIEMRVPKEFTLMQRPEPPAEGEEEPEPVVDTRHPVSLGIDRLPGLIDAWRASLPAEGGGQVTALLYVTGNHERFLVQAQNDGVGAPPEDYLADLKLLLSNSLGVTVTPGDGSRDNEEYEETIPRDDTYAIPKTFGAISYLPPNPTPVQGGGAPLQLRLQLYTYEDGPIQLAIMLVYPTSARSNPTDSLKIALETLKVSPDPPQVQRPGGEETGGRERGF